MGSFNIIQVTIVLHFVFCCIKQGRCVWPIGRHSPKNVESQPEMIRNRGYPVEVHQLSTEDGYILELHRIPHGQGPRKNRLQKKPVFLQHGHYGASTDWIRGPTENSLAYLLADLGYDVWLGNIRGNFYSRRHVTLDPNEDEYWDFLWHEMGTYDIPACINYVLRVTRQPRLSFVGYSYSCNHFFIAMTQRPEMNRKVDVMIALGPTVRMSSSLRKMLPYARDPRTLGHTLSTTRNFWLTGLYRDLHFENEAGEPQEHHSASNAFNFFRASLGYARKLTTTNDNVETFQAYDYGQEGNLKHYGTAYPIHYNLKLVTVPTYIFYGESDIITPPEDLKWLVDNLGNVKGLYKVPDSKFTHIDFVNGENVLYVAYNKILTILPPP